MSNSTRRPQAGFTLIELLTVIAIIGILASIIIPTLGAVQEGVKRSVEATNLRSIGQGALAYGAANDGFMPDPKSEKQPAGDLYHTWMAILAKSGDMTDPKMYFSKIDKNFPAPKDIPASILKKDRVGVDDTMTSETQAWELIGGLKTGDAATTPIAYTRGLTTAGTWELKKGVYADWGGHMVFLNGSTATFQGGVKDKLTSTTEEKTSNIKKTVKQRGTKPTQLFYGPGGIASSIGTPSGTTPEK